MDGVASEGFHKSGCGCAWQSHRQSHRSEPVVCRNSPPVYGDDGFPLVDDDGKWVRKKCDCTEVAPRHFQRRVIGADVYCNCGWQPNVPDEDWDTPHADRGVYV